jgi:hypothetical protein
MNATVFRHGDAGTGPGRHRIRAACAPEDDPDVRRRAASPSAAVPRAAGTRTGTSGDILAEAWRPGVAEPVAVHVRPEVLARLLVQPSSTSTPGPAGEGSLRPLGRVPVVIDDGIPMAPGYEIHRAPPTPRGDRPGSGERRLNHGISASGTAPTPPRRPAADPPPEPGPRRWDSGRLSRPALSRTAGR